MRKPGYSKEPDDFGSALGVDGFKQSERQVLYGRTRHSPEFTARHQLCTGDSQKHPACKCPSVTSNCGLGIRGSRLLSPFGSGGQATAEQLLRRCRLLSHIPVKCIPSRRDGHFSRQKYAFPEATPQLHETSIEPGDLLYNITSASHHVEMTTKSR